MFTISDLCLLCLTNNTNLKSILTRDSDDVIVKEKLKSFISIKIEPEDSVLCICWPCLEKLNNVYNYKQLCVRNVNKFTSFVQKLKSTNETYINLQVTCENELNSDSIKTENSKIDNVTVENDPNEDSNYRHKLEVVGEIFVEESNEISDDIENKAEDENVSDDETEHKFVEVFIKEETDFNYDITDLKTELYNDEISNGTDNNEESTSKSIPRSKKSYKCNECQKSFTRQDYLMKHRPCHTGEKPGTKNFKCDICDKVFNEKGNLTTHIRSHTGEKPYKCDVCDKTFSHSSSVVVHKRCHTGEKPFKCVTCDKAFTNKSILVKHIRCHTEEKPFNCDMCDMKFSVRYNLELHKRFHTGEKPHKCDICDKAFSHRSNLVKHKLCHTGEKPFKCDVCDKAFNRRYHLVTHLRCHTGEKPYNCDVCHKAFGHRASLVKHKLSHTGEKPFNDSST